MTTISKQISGDEQDCFSRRWRRTTRWPSGKAKRIKRGFNRRVRRLAKAIQREVANG